MPAALFYFSVASGGITFWKARKLNVAGVEIFLKACGAFFGCAFANA
jgi:hypothetical protein